MKYSLSEYVDWAMCRTFSGLGLFPPACLLFIVPSPSLQQDSCSHQICSTFCSLSINILIHGIMTVFPKSYKIILMIPNIIARRWGKIGSSREEVWYSSLLGGLLSTSAATCLKSLLVSPFAHNYCCLCHCHSANLSFFPGTVPNVHVWSGPCPFPHSDNRPECLFLIQHLFLFPFSPQCF